VELNLSESDGVEKRGSAIFTLKGKKIYIYGVEEALEKPQKKAIYPFHI